jgi:hypothetical protein
VPPISRQSKARVIPDEHLDLALDGTIPQVTGRVEAPGNIAAFARHETFHPRYGWIKKGYDAAVRNPHVFLQDDATVVLGVGKNMVRAIRYWCHATKVLQETPGTRGAGSVPTVFGRRLLGNDGLDLYLENLGSLWFLHWHLLAPPCIASAWHFAFNVFVRQEFTLDELNASLADHVSREFGATRLAASSLRKDTSCIARMYAEVPSTASVGEDSIQCPFAELGLLRPVGPKSFAYNIGSKPGLTSWIVAATALEFAARFDTNARTVSLSTLLHSPGSPGLVFKLTEAALYSALEEAASNDRSIELTDAAGLIQLSFSEKPLEIGARLLRRHFGTSRPGRAVA